MQPSACKQQARRLCSDKIADEPGAAALVGRLVEHRVIELLVTHVQMDQIAAIPDEGRRKQLLRAIPCRVVPTHGVLYGVSKYGMARYTSPPVDATSPKSSDGTKRRTP